MALEQKLENIDGNLRDAYKQCVPGTALCVDQLMRERQTNSELRNLCFYTPDGEVYSIEDNIPTLRITRESTKTESGLVIINPVLKNIDAAFDQLVTTGNYQVIPADFEAVKNAIDTVTVDLTKLKLQGDDKEWRYLAVGTSKAITKYNAEQQKLLRRVFGPTEEDYATNMKMLKTSPQKIEETHIYVLNPDYVKVNAETGPIGRASWLGSFSSSSDVDAVDRGISGSGRVRGVRRVVVPEGAPKKEGVQSAPQKIVAPTFKQVLAYSERYVCEASKPEFDADLRKLYNL
jgi:hypothetical protein